jgi:hypothetical protein
MSLSQDNNILDLITIADSLLTLQRASTAIQNITNEPRIKATNLNIKHGNAMKKKVRQTLGTG